MQPTLMPDESASGVPLLNILNLQVAFPLDEGLVHAVDGVSLRLDTGHGIFRIYGHVLFIAYCAAIQ